MGGKQSKVGRPAGSESERAGGTSKDEKIKIVVIGDSGVGKSALVRRFVEDRWESDDASPTIGVDFAVKTVERRGHSVKVSVWDCAGQEKFHAVIPGYYRLAHGAVVVYDLCDGGETLEGVENWIADLRQSAPDGVRFVVVGNKSDCPAADVSLERKACRLSSHLGGCGAFITSARSGSNVREAFLTLVDAIGEAAPEPKPDETKVLVPNRSDDDNASCVRSRSRCLI